MKKRAIRFVLLGMCIALLCGCHEKEEKEDKTTNQEAEALEIESGTHFFDKLEKTGDSVPEDSMEKVETGIKNWAQSSLGMDDTISEESKEIIDEKLYAIIVSSEQSETVKEERETFYKDASVSTESVEVEIESADAAQYNDQTIGIVECKVTIKGTRNDESFERIYDLTLSMDYQHDIASVYEIGNIELER